MKTGKIVKVSGPLIIAEGMAECKMFDVVQVSDKKLIGEIIELRGDKASIQVYEETSGLGPDEDVVSTGEPLSVELAPGLIEGIYDGIQRPLAKLKEMAGDRIERGVYLPAVDHEKLWAFKPAVAVGDRVECGSVVGTVQENVLITHKIMVP
ncbi:MAG: V-type ATP synthase subunit A, partial [[Eubacterium] siraeum]|nr:V-type ATP synthase subunit A [[Eubacterium] siraeum]